jgi:hypothetical protein
LSNRRRPPRGRANNSEWSWAFLRSKFAAEGATAVEISSHSPEVAKVSEQVSILSLEGEELKISFNSKYMMDPLKALDATDIEIQFTGSIRPFIFLTTLFVLSVRRQRLFFVFWMFSETVACQDRISLLQCE